VPTVPNVAPLGRGRRRVTITLQLWELLINDVALFALGALLVR
jgi:hypothetical protein